MIDITDITELEKIEPVEQEECMICFYKKPLSEYVIFNCNHKVCINCYELINKCPICYTPFDIVKETTQIINHDTINLPHRVIYIPTQNIELMTHRESIRQINLRSFITSILCIILCGMFIFIIIGIVTTYYRINN